MVSDPTAKFVPADFAEVITLTREGNGCFDDLVTTLANLLTYLFTAAAIRSGEPPVVPQRPFTVSANTTDRIYTVFPMHLLWALSQDEWIDELLIYVNVEMPSKKRGGELVSEGHRRILRRMVEGPFIRYFEASREKLTAAAGEQPEGWPEPWNFARILRNAFAHGGINFRSSSATPVRWRSIEFGPADNGTDPLFPPVGLGDLVDLYMELDAAL